MTLLARLAQLAKEKKDAPKPSQKDFVRKRIPNYVPRRERGDDLSEWRKDERANGKSGKQ